MTNRRALEEEYFQWLCSLISLSPNEQFSKLTRILFNTPFYAIIEMDENRIKDGLYLRYDFSFHTPCRYEEIDYILQDKKCSVFEMMVALCERIEDGIMSNTKYGNRTGYWFREMLKSLGLYDMRDNNFDEEFVRDCLIRFVSRCYDDDGSGGLFTIEDSPLDLRDVEIWKQMCLYLDHIKE